MGITVDVKALHAKIRKLTVDFAAALEKAEIAISMDGKGVWRNNVFVKRLWRSIRSTSMR